MSLCRGEEADDNDAEKEGGLYRCRYAWEVDQGTSECELAPGLSANAVAPWMQ